MKNSYVVGAIILVAVIIVVLLLAPRWWGGEEPAPPPAPVAPPAMPAEPAALPEPVMPTLPREEPEPPLPSLQESDPLVREALAPMGIPESWVGQGDLVRRLAVVVENAARGDYPRRQLAFLAPAGPFRVLQRDDDSFIMDPAGYGRYDGYVDMLERMPPEQMASLLQRIEPLLTQALMELGVQGDAENLLDAAIDQAMAVPVLEGDVRLEQPNVLFVYADPQLESLSPLQKQMLRTGPDNVRRMQAYLSKVRASL
jgi:hypothetical protein